MTPHQKIMRAYRRGTGLRLSPFEIGHLGQDGAIETRASNDDEFACEDAGHVIGEGPKSCPRCRLVAGIEAAEGKKPR